MTSHGSHGVSNHRQLECLFNSLLRLMTKKTYKPFIAGPIFGVFGDGGGGGVVGHQGVIKNFPRNVTIIRNLVSLNFARDMEPMVGYIRLAKIYISYLYTYLYVTFCCFSNKAVNKRVNTYAGKLEFRWSTWIMYFVFIVHAWSHENWNIRKCADIWKDSRTVPQVSHPNE